MGKSSIPSCLEKRDLLNRSAVSVDQLIKWGQACEEEGLINDAVDFYDRAKSVESLERLIPLVMDEGDAFLLSKIMKVLNRDAEPEQWSALARRASELGKDAFAAMASEKSGLEASPSAEDSKAPK